MPELPEVETIRRGLSPLIVKKKILDASIYSPSSLKFPESDFIRIIQGNQIQRIERKGKLLVFPLEYSSELLLVHLKMTGQLIYVPSKNALPDAERVEGGHSFSLLEQELPGKFTRLALTFEDQSRLFFNDVRRFGYWQLVTPEQFDVLESKYGIEPGTPDFTRENFVKIVNSTRSVKAVLLDQTRIAGLGNIYVDEACFRARVLPQRSMKSLVKSEVEGLFTAIDEVIATAIEHRGTSFRDYRDSEGNQGNFKQLLQVYARSGHPCVQCGRPIQKTRLAGRGTHFCASCQK